MTYRRQFASWLSITFACMFFSAPLLAQNLGLRSTLYSDTEAVCCLAFSPDGKILASAGNDRNDTSIRSWDVASGKLRSAEESPASWIDFGGKSLPSRVPTSVAVWKTAGSVGTILDKRAMCIDSVVEFSSDGKTLASGNVFDSEIKLWDLATKKNIASFKINGVDGCSAMTFLPGDKTLALLRFNRTGIDLWDVASCKKTATLAKDKYLICATFSSDGKTMAAVSADSAVVSLLEVPSGKEQATLKGHKANVRCVICSPDGKTLASGSEDGKIMLWDLKTGRDIVAIGAHTKAINALAFSADGKMLASGGKDKAIKVWDVAPGK